MINFLRKVRHKTISGNTSTDRISRYLLYAIGEIALVVLGILIALSINTWNEERKNQAFEKDILQQIRANLIRDKLALIDIQINFEDAMNSTDKILNTQWTPQENDSLQYWMADIVRFDRFQPLTNAYEVIKSKGLDLITNKQLRFIIGAYYDDEIKSVMKSIEDVELTFKEDWINIIRRETKDFKFGKYAVLRNIDVLKGDTEITNILRTNKDNFDSGNLRIKKGIRSIDRIISLLGEELR